MIRTEVQHDGQLLHVRLDAPPGNIIDHGMVQALDRAVRDASARPGIKAVRFEGAGSDFSLGASIDEHTSGRAEGMLHRFHDLFRALAEAAVPTMAVVQGRCLGRGFELAAYCTWLFASPGALFAQSEIRLGLFAPMASLVLPWRLGGGSALDLCVGGRTWTAGEAHRRGLVESVSDDPHAAADEFFLQHLAPRSATALRFTERAARRGLTRALEEHLGVMERAYLEELLRTHDAREGVEAFIEGRPARFEDR